MTTPTLGRAAPLRFLIGVTLCWTLGRVAVLADWSGGGEAARPHHGHRPPRMAGTRPGKVSIKGRAASSPCPPPSWRPIVRMVTSSAPAPLSPPGDLPSERNAPGPPSRRSDMPIIDASAVIAPFPPGRSRWSGSAWAFARGGGRTHALAPVGQIGGGQAGGRLLYRLDDAGRLASSGRLSRTIGGPRQTEAALGLDWRPLARLPVHILADRRFAIDRGGRDAWALGVAGGVDAVRLAGHWRLDGYGEAGVVGARRRDLYADGAIRIAHAIDLGRSASLALGGGMWGAAQPGARRLDIGPSAVLRLPVARHAVSVALDWRERVAGEAKPGSGIAFTVAADF